MRTLKHVAQSAIFGGAVRITVNGSVTCSVVVTEGPRIRARLLGRILGSVSRSPYVLSQVGNGRSRISVTFGGKRRHERQRVDRLMNVDFGNASRCTHRTHGEIRGVHRCIVGRPRFSGERSVRASVHVCCIRARRTGGVGLGCASSYIRVSTVVERRFVQSCFRGGSCYAT